MTKQLSIVFFTFNRPEQTKKVFSTIREARPSELVLISDGPRAGVPADMSRVAECRRIISEVDWPCNVYTDFAEVNLGLRERLLSGLDFAFEKVDSAIILEDDCLPHPSFFEFAACMLDEFVSVNEVGIISGANFAPYLSVEDFHFSNSPYIWGWATWKRVWVQFRASPQVETWSTAEYKKISETFSAPGQWRSFKKMMQQAPRLATWDVSFAAWFRLTGFLSVVPKSNLIKNIGFGDDATHTLFEPFDQFSDLQSLPSPYRAPVKLEADCDRERAMWRRKSFSWLVFPIRHPISFGRRLADYFRLRLRKVPQ